MPDKFQWSEVYSIENEQIDAQHRHLFELANVMLKCAGSESDLEKIKETIGALYRYVKTHFRNEEHLMASMRYPLLREHQVFHEEIIMNMNKIMKNSASLEVLIYKFKRLLLDWVTMHIQQEDKKIALFLQKEEKNKAGIQEGEKME